MSMIRTRWAAIGAAVAITLGGGGVGLVGATVDSGQRLVLVPIEPCRIVDTRPDYRVGPRSTPIGASEIYTVAAHGTNGECTIPNDAEGLSLNVTAVDATQSTFLTIFASAVARPNASHLNPAPGQPPTPNAVTTELSASGEFDIFNKQGTVHVLADVVGYYAHHNHGDLYYTKSEVDSKLNRSISISGAAFRARSALTTSTIGSGGELWMAGGTDDRFYAPLVLPHGATITAVHATLWDGVVSDYLRLEVQRVAYVSGYSTLATIESTTSIGADTPYTAPTVVDGTIDTTLYTYVVSIYDPVGVWGNHGSDLRFQGVRIDYTM